MTRTEWVQALDFHLLLAGAVLGLFGLVRELRLRGWRDPLAGLAPAPPGPNLAQLILVVLALFLLSSLAGSSASMLTDGRHEQPGSAGWHAQQLGQGVANLLVAALCALLLAQARRAEASPASMEACAAVAERSRAAQGGAVAERSPSSLGAAIAAVWLILGITPVCLLLWGASQAAWIWFAGAPASSDHPVLQALADSAWGVVGVALLVLGAVVIAPLFEELLFRGVFLQAVWAAGGRPWPAVVVSAIVFGLLHGARPADVPPLILLGIALGVLRLRSGSLAACVLAHALFNARTMAIALLAPELVRSA